MTGIKFECPGCGQHLECDKACCGDVIHCPRCCAELRIPFPKPQEIPGTIERAELLMHAPASPTAGLEALNAPPTDGERKTAAEPIEICCPVCNSELRVRARDSTKANHTGVAELLRTGHVQPQPQLECKRAQESVAQKQKENEPPHPDVNHMTIEERERHIAAAREARPVGLYAAMKPRLDKVLSNDLAPVTSADGPGTAEKHVKRPPRGAEGGANRDGFSE